MAITPTYLQLYRDTPRSHETIPRSSNWTHNYYSDTNNITREDTIYLGNRVVQLRVWSNLLSWFPEIMVQVLFFNHACISERYIMRKTLVYRTPANPNPWERNKTEKYHKGYFVAQPYLLHLGYEIPTNFPC
jgi:hypothetical protein